MVLTRVLVKLPEDISSEVQAERKAQRTVEALRIPAGDMFQRHGGSKADMDVLSMALSTVRADKMLG